MEIRPARREDVGGVLPMVRRVCAFHEGLDPPRYGVLPDVERRYEQWLGRLADDERGVFFVAERDDGGLVGFIIGTVERAIPIYRVAEYGFLHDLWVEEAYRHEGLGRLLAMRAVERFRELGVRQVRLETAAANESARRLFAQCGMRASSVEMMIDFGEDGPRPAAEAAGRVAGEGSEA